MSEVCIDVWHYNQSLIFHLKHWKIKVKVPTLESAEATLWSSMCILFPFVLSVWQEKKTCTYGTGIPNWRCYKQASWMIFKFNGASEFVFPKIIKSLPIPAPFFNSLPGHSPKHCCLMGFPTFAWEYIENINTLGVGLFILKVVKSFGVNSKANLYK